MLMLEEVTPRQLDFLKALYDLSMANQGVAHYTKVAGHLGVNRYSAYDMLRVLERKGLAATDYVLASNKDGPGRSRVMFYPTRRGTELLQEAGVLVPVTRPSANSLNYVSPEEWSTFKESILRRLQETRQMDKRDLVMDLLSRLPERRRSLHYCAQMVFALVLVLDRAQERMLAAVSPFEVLQTLTTDDEASLSALAGLGLGSALMTDSGSDAGLVNQLLGQMQSFQLHLHSLSGDGKHRLISFLREAIQVVDSSITVPSTPQTVDGR
jgi:hypothetical protein